MKGIRLKSESEGILYPLTLYKLVRNTDGTKNLSGELDTIHADISSVREELESLLLAGNFKPEILEALQSIQNYLDNEGTAAEQLLADVQELKANSLKHQVISSAEYDSLEVKEENTLYLIYD